MKSLTTLTTILIVLTSERHKHVVRSEGDYDNRSIHVLHMFSTDITGRPHVPGREAVDFAVQLINSRQDILPGYTIHVHDKDVEQIQVGEAMKAFIDAISHDPVKIGMIGPTFSSQTEVLAQTAGFFNLVEISYTATSPSLSDMGVYPYLLRTVESAALFNFAIRSLIQHFRWRYVASIAYDTEFVMWSREHLINLLLERNVTIIESASYSHKTISHTRELKSSQARILISHSYFRSSLDTRRFFCEIYKEGIYGRKYQWFHWTYKWGVEGELQAQDYIHDGCSLDNLHEAMEGMFMFAARSMDRHDYQTVIGSHGMTTERLIEQFHEFVNNSGDEYRQDGRETTMNYMYTAFDAMWSFALALNKSISDFDDIGASIESFTYDRSDMADILFENIRNLQFYGANGPMSFDAAGDYIAEIEIFQMRKGERVTVGYYSPFTDSLHWIVDEKSLFPDLPGRPPYDKDIIVVSNKTQSRGLFYTACVLASLGIIYSTLTFAYTWMYRHTKYIKMSSPRINGLICFGCILTYIAVIVWGVDISTEATAKAICKLRVWFLVIGFTCAFGSMFSKTWRVHKIISTKTLERKVVKDGQLFLFVLCFFALDAVILFIWELVDPLQQEQLVLQIEEDNDKDGIIYQPTMYVCSCEHGGYWSGVFYSVKGLLLIFGIFFAWETRNVQIEGLNDSKLIGVCVYSVMVSSVVAVPLVNILSEEQYNIIYGITVISMLLCCTLIITLVFAIKAYTILRYGEKVDDLVVTHFQATQNAATIDHRHKTISPAGPEKSTYSTPGHSQGTLKLPPSNVYIGKANRVSPGLDN